MLLFSDRENVPWVVYAFEAFLIAGAVVIVGGTASCVIHLWADSPWSLRWIADCVALAILPLGSLWIYVGDLGRDKLLPFGMITAVLVGALLGVVTHYAVAWYYSVGAV
jgi:hypothetical protein